MEKSNSTQKILFKKYSWILAIIVFLMGQGGVWAYFEYRENQQTTSYEKIILENELRKGLLLLQDQGIELLESYNKKKTPLQQLKLKLKLIQRISEYNEIEAQLSILQNRQPKWSKIPLLINLKPPKNLRIRKNKDGSSTLAWDHSEPDEVTKEVTENLKKLFERFEQTYHE